jgi:hypothetical protein
MTISSLRSALAFALVLWCAGTGCLVVSYAEGTAMGGSVPARANGESAKDKPAPATMKGHACCRARHRALRNESIVKFEDSDVVPQTLTVPEESDPTGVNSCCPLTSGTFVIASHSQTQDDQSSGPAQTGSLARSLVTDFLATRTTPLRLSNHEHTYLVYCAFLI